MKSLQDFFNENGGLVITDYFDLTEKEKRLILEFIVNIYDKYLIQDPNLIRLFLASIQRFKDKATEEENYEVCDILQRAYNHLEEKYLYFKYFPRED